MTASVNVRETIQTVACPSCGAPVGRGCAWFYGYDESAVHPERWEQYGLYQAERRKLAEWNAAARPAEAGPA